MEKTITKYYPIQIKLPDYVEKVSRLLLKSGADCYLYGGCVRDAVLRKDPNDYDICVNIPIGEVQEILTREGIELNTSYLFIQYLIANVDGEDIDISSFCESSLEERMMSVDFTINALMYDIRNQVILDCVGGMEDITNKLLRKTPWINGSDDPKSILRALRFALQLDYKIEPATYQALIDLLPQVEHMRTSTMQKGLEKILKYGRDALIHKPLFIPGVTQSIRRVDMERIGGGFTSDVYRINDETVVKVFNQKAYTKLIQSENDKMRAALIEGLPVVIPFGTIDVEGELGIVMEFIGGRTLADIFQKKHSLVDQHIARYAEFMRSLNKHKADNTVFPRAEAAMLMQLEYVSEDIPREDYEKMMSLIKGIEDTGTFIHGDCQLNNIVVTPDDVVLLDLYTSTSGNPIYELSGIYCPYVAFEESIPGNSESFFNMDKDATAYIFYETVRKYLNHNTEEQLQRNLDRIKLLGHLHMIFMMKFHFKDKNDVLKKNVEWLHEYIEKVEDLNLEGM